MNDWLAKHTLLHDALLICATLIATYLSTKLPYLWEVFRVQPGNLNTWLLRLRLKRAQNVLATFYKMRDNTNYLIFVCFETLFLFCVGIVLLSYFIFLTAFETIAVRSNLTTMLFLLGPHDDATLAHIAFFAFSTSYLLTAMALFQTTKITAVFRNTKKKEARLAKAVNRKIIELREKDPQMVIDSDVDRTSL